MGFPQEAAELYVDKERVDVARRHVRATVARSGTSFLIGMKILPKFRRDAMYAIYAFCREVDDVADEPGEPRDKLEQLAEWRAEIDRLYAGAPTRQTTIALSSPVQRFGLPRDEFMAILDGMEMDVGSKMWAPPMSELELYCRRVAGAVGVLSIRVFGTTEPHAVEFALKLAEALQLTNILRDIEEDAALGRLYLPRDLLDTYGIDSGDRSGALRHPGLPVVCRALAKVARQRFEEADMALSYCDRRTMRPALLMMGVYDVVLRRLTEQDWNPRKPPARLSKLDKCWAALRYGLFRRRWQPST
jgi:phytoene synthase